MRWAFYRHKVKVIYHVLIAVVDWFVLEQKNRWKVTNFFKFLLYNSVTPGYPEKNIKNEKVYQNMKLKFKSKFDNSRVPNFVYYVLNNTFRCPERKKKKSNLKIKNGCYPLLTTKKKMLIKCVT